jgi:endonuclease/exonuclease/phosphatase family metal-dependent hydrolase
MHLKRLYIVIVIAGLIMAAVAVLLIKAGIPSGLGQGTVVSAENGGQQPQGTEGTVSLVSYNIHYGSGYYDSYIKGAEGDDRYTYLNQVADIIRDADIVALQEVDLSLKRSHFINEAEYLAQKVGFRYWAFADNWNFKLFPFTSPVHFSRTRTGHAILSRYPVKESHVTIFDKPRASLWHRMFFLWRTQQYADIVVDGRTLRLFNVHLESESRTDREDQAVQLVDLAKESPYPVVLMGDFNALMPEASEKDFPREDYVNDSTISTIRSSGLMELFPAEEYLKDEHSYFTFTSKEPTRRLDYLYRSGDIAVLSAKILREQDASDHLPLKVEIRIDR